MTRVFLARHGEPAPVQGSARTEWPLSRFGRNQAEHLADRLWEFAPLNVISGPSVRCRQSADLAAKALGRQVKIDPRLSDVPVPRGTADPEAWLGQTFNFEQAVYWRDLGPELNKWRTDTIQVVRELVEPAVLFTQFTNINAIFGAALKLESTVGCKPDYASLTEFSVVSGDIRLVMDGREIKGPDE